MSARVLALLALLLSLSGCKDRGDPPPSYDASRVRRVFRPPPGEVRPVPPHAIHTTGVGPYLLRTSLKSILDRLPHGPRVVLTRIDGVVDYNLVRAEADSLIIGVQRPAGVSFVTVLDNKIARTESKVGVGTPVRRLRKAMGEELAVPGLAMDPRMLGFDRLPNVRFVVDRPDERGKVVAVVVRGDVPAAPKSQVDAGAAPKATDEPAPTCNAATELAYHKAAVVAAAKVRSSTPTVIYGCFTEGPGALVISDGTLTVVAGEDGRHRRLATHRVPDLAFAVATELDDDGRQEIAIVSRRETERERSAHVEVLRMDGGRLVRLVARELYRVESTSAAWVGATLDAIDLLIELQVTEGSLKVTGLYIHNGKDRPRTVAPLLTTTIPVRLKRTSASDAPPASAEDGGAGAANSNDAAPAAKPPGDIRKAVPDARPAPR